MRVFGLFTVFAAVTSVFAAPVPAAVGSNSVDLASRDLTSDIFDIITDLKVKVDEIKPKLETALETIQRDSQLDLLPNLSPLLTRLTGSITDAVTLTGLSAVKDFFNFEFKEKKRSDLQERAPSLEEIGNLIQEVEQDVADILCKVANFIGDEHPDVAIVLQGVITILNGLTTAIDKVCTDLSPYVTPIADLLEPIIGTFGYSVPDFE